MTFYGLLALIMDYVGDFEPAQDNRRWKATPK